jgi:hypothetical protein
MASDLIETPVYRHTMAELEKVKRVSEQGVDYWMGREIHALLGYPVWDKFVPVIEKAAQSFGASGVESSHHIAQSSKLMGSGKGAQREGVDYFLSRGACYLIAINGDPTNRRSLPRKPTLLFRRAGRRSPTWRRVIGSVSITATASAKRLGASARSRVTPG